MGSVTDTGKLKNIILNRLQCSICTEIFNKPLMVNCGHTFCKNCIDKWIEQNKKSSKCPLCRSPILLSSPNQALLELIEELNDNSFLPNYSKKESTQGKYMCFAFLDAAP